MLIRSIAAAGDGGLLVTIDGATAGSVAALTAQLLDSEGIAAAVPGYESVLVLFTGSQSMEVRHRLIERCAAGTRVTAAPSNRVTHRLTVSLHESVAPDLPLLLEQAYLSRESFADALRSTTFTARFLGFRPGFAYLESVPESWQLPRRPRPRRAVPAGSFAIAGAMAAFYPSESPGGWNLIGRTGTTLWDPTREPPNLLGPGDQIAIEPTFDELPFDTTERIGDDELVAWEAIAEVISPGQLTLITPPPDLSRLRYGLPSGGAFDEEAAQVANQRVGNVPDAAVLECTFVGPSLRFMRDAVLSIGGGAPHVTVRGSEVAYLEQILVRAGDEIVIGRVQGAARAVVAVSGAVAAAASRFATEPRRLRAGDVIRSERPAGHLARFHHLDRLDHDLIDLVAGPHRISAESLDALVSRTYVVSPESNRVGVRLRPESPFEFRPPASIPSCGMQRGTIQWQPDGDLVVMGPDHPVTGGYLQPATVTSRDLWKIARLSPGDRVRLRWADATIQNGGEISSA